MTCASCQQIHVFNMDCRQCLVRWLQSLPYWYARDWIKKYRDKHGEPAMLQLIDEVKQGS